MLLFLFMVVPECCCVFEAQEETTGSRKSKARLSRKNQKSTQVKKSLFCVFCCEVLVCVALSVLYKGQVIKVTDKFCRGDEYEIIPGEDEYDTSNCLEDAYPTWKDGEIFDDVFEGFSYISGYDVRVCVFFFCLRVVQTFDTGRLERIAWR